MTFQYVAVRAQGALLFGFTALILSGTGGCGNSQDATAPEAGSAGAGMGGSAGSRQGGSGGSSAAGSGGSSVAGAGGSGGSSAGGSAGSSPAGAGGTAAADAGNTCNAPTPGVNGACAMYPGTSIAAIRNPAAPGCYELSHVGLVARTDSPSEPRLYVQDANGGDYSAIMAKCSPTAQHACSPAVMAKIPLLFDTMTAGAKLSVRGFYQAGKVGGFEEFFIEDVIDECATVARPAPIVLTVANLARDARVPAKWFRRASIDVPASDPLKIYDFSPPELQLPKTTCPDWQGFAMIPSSAGAAPATGCTGKSNPATRVANPREVLVGRQFFNQFLFTGDCNCASASPNERLLAPGSSVSGPVLGYLVLEQDKGATMSYQVFEPAADKSFPLH